MKKQQPPESEPAALAAVMACAIIAAVVLIFTSLADDKNSQDNWLYRYQTLITGMLAVGAAFATIRQMRISDALQEQRHHREMNILRLEPTLAVMRVGYSTPVKLRRASGRIKQFVELIPDDAFEPAWDENSRQLAASSIYQIRAVNQTLHSKEWTEASRYFDPLVCEAAEQVKEWVTTVLSSVPTGRLPWDGDGRPEWFAAGLGMPIWDAMTSIEALAHEIDRWVSDFTASVDHV